MTSIGTVRTNGLKEIVLHYLQGEDISVIKVRLQAKCAESGKSSKSLYKSILLKNTHRDPYIRAILSSLNIKPHKHPPTQSEYERLLEKSDDLYALLMHLYHDGHRHVGHLLQLIEHTKPKTNWALIFTLGTVASAGIGGLLYVFREKVEAVSAWFIRTFPSIIKWITKPATLLRFTPFVGIIYNGLGLIWSLYQTFANGTTTTTEKLHKLFFKTLTSGFTISAYALSYVAAGAMTVPIAILFVLGASVDVFQGGFNLIKSQRALKTLAIPKEDAAWEVIAEYERAKNSHQHALKSVWIKISTAFLITGAVAIWHFFPPNLVLTIVSMAFISLAGLAKRSILNNFAEKSANDLQSKLRRIEIPLKPELSPANKKTLIKLTQRQQSLEAKERELDAREQALDEREEKLLARTLSSPAQALALLRKEATKKMSTTAPLSNKKPAHPTNTRPSANDEHQSGKEPAPSDCGEASPYLFA